ncbi:MAG TPA: glycoside hydrolase family 27 protein [Bacteroides sp.]|nr:glycoside hydrolase family 27 protein [Bacteroides sp.]
MGWNSWNSTGVNVSEEILRGIADEIVASGLKDAGYTYVVIDDFWHGGRDSITGILYEDPAKFPSGMKALADYIHEKGLKFGIYSDAGTKTCGEMPGSYGYEEKDAQLFADWGVDYLKYDYCFCPDYVSANNDYRMAIDRYKAMGDALKATGRPIIYSLCEWGPRSPWLWGREVGGHLWRTSYDVYDMWDSPRNATSPIGIMASVDAVTNLSRFAGPGGWNDPDMLVVGLNNTGNIKGGGCNDIEYRSQMSMWCMLAAPLMIGSDIREMNESTRTILLNKDIIAIDQDELGKQGFRVFRKDGMEAWQKPLSGDRVAIAFLNRNSWDGSLTTNWKELELDPDIRYSAYDVWEHKSVNHPEGELSVNLKPHECQVFVLSLSQSE